MPTLLRKIVVFAVVDGLVLQSPGSLEPSAALRIEYKSQKITSTPSIPAEELGQKPHLESHGIIGLLSVASASFLIAITRREQVAQIFGKPIYVVTDVALVPLLSQHEAERGINAAIRQKETTADTDEDSSDTEPAVDESTDVHSAVDTQEAPSPADDVRTKSDKDESTTATNIAKDVFARRGPYGKFASQWFTRKGWALPGMRDPGKNAEDATDSTQAADSATTQDPSATGPQDVSSSMPQEESSSEQAQGSTTKEGNQIEAGPDAKETTFPLLPKLLRSTRLILSSRSFYFSYDFNITRRLEDSRVLNSKPFMHEDVDPLYFWNQNLGAPFTNVGLHPFLMPIMQGFVGQRHFIVKKNAQEDTQTEAYTSLEGVLRADQGQEPEKQPAALAEHQRPFLLTLISRRSTKRSGLRYLRRGIDDHGNCANTVETEQILSSPMWDRSSKYRCFVQVRGSVPLYFSQSPYAFKPIPVLHQSAAVNQAAFQRHFDDLGERYGSVQIALLVDKHGGEAKIGEEYERMTNQTNGLTDGPQLKFEWFDFHSECRGMKFENVARLVNVLQSTTKAFGESVIQGGKLLSHQTGIIRTNCMDCLDRTNVAQSAFAQYMLQQDLEDEGFEIDLLHDDSTQWFNTLWADNGDAISRQYASTAALKGDFTRTRKRNYRGALNDFGLTITRYYNNMFNDYFSQAVIDVLLGNVSAKVFDDFETNMMSADPGISIENIREHAIETCRKIIQAPDENLIHAWPVLTPAQPNTLRTLPFEESVLLLTDAALYGCKFDWTTEKVIAFEKVDLRAITSIHYGTYITSTFTERQTDEAANVGIAVLYTPGRESVMRVNTRSLQSSLDDDPATSKAVKDVPSSSGKGSWLGSRAPAPSQTMALKLISSDAGSQTAPAKTDTSHLDSARQICEEIQRAISSDKATQLVEHTDIISLEEARKRVGYLEQLSHSIKKLVWT